MKNKFVILLICLSFSVIVAASESPQNISSFIDELPILNSINCRFKQEKYLKNVNRVIVSGGNFSFKKNAGVCFETTYPIKYTVSYNNRDYKQINDIISAISTKNYSALQKEFDFYFTKKNHCWNLKLVPNKKSQVYDIIESITIIGEKNINKITILLLNGNKTILWFLTN